MIIFCLNPFQEVPERGHDACRSFHYSSIYDEASVLRDLRSPIAYIFGGESGPPMPELFQACDVGGFIPSCAGSDPHSSSRTPGHKSQSHCGAGDADPSQSREQNEMECEARMHSCNLSIAACIVLSERHRLLLAKRQNDVVGCCTALAAAAGFGMQLASVATGNSRKGELFQPATARIPFGTWLA